MIIIWGFRAIARKIGGGVFFCPKCGGDRDYVHQRVTRWFTLFWIPLVPISKALGEQVQCTQCKTKFKMSVLATPTSAALAEQVRTATRVAASALVAAGDRLDPTARAAAVAAVQSAGVAGYDDATLSLDIDHIEISHLAAHVSPLAAGLNSQGREVFVGRLAAIAPPGGLSAEQLSIMHTVGASLQLSAAHLAGVLGIATPSPVVGLPSFAPFAAGEVPNGPDGDRVSAVPELSEAPAQEPAPTPSAAPPASPPAAWYPDPAGSGGQRWWDGQDWTDHVQ